jgi:outer membrane protein assembly factor BamB
MLALMLFLSGCGTKRQYFKSDSVEGSVKLSGSLSSSLKEVARNGASLKDGRIITLKSGENNVEIEEGYSFLGEFDNKFIAVSPIGEIHVKNSNNLLLYTLNLNAMIASASIDGETLAAVTSDNMLYLADINTGSVFFQKKMDTVTAIDSRIAAPYFLGGLVIFPTLDGKLAIVDKDSQTVVNSVVVSGEREFNNIIFLDISGDRMFAATAKRIIAINSDGSINYIDKEIKDAVVADERVFIFTKDGKIFLCDLELKILSEKKFPFAIFAGVSANKKLYILEKMGYLIKSDFELKEFEIFKFPYEIDDFLFITKNKIFYKDSFYALE